MLVFSCVFTLCVLLVWILCHIYLLSPQRALCLQSAQKLARVQKKQKKTTYNFKNRRSLQRHRPLFIWKEDQHTAGLFTAVDLLDWYNNFGEKKSSFKIKCLEIYLFFFPTRRCIHFISSFFFFNRCAEGFQFSDDLNPKTRKNLIDYWNCDMNRPYKMPRVVGGRRAQKEEVFSIIHLLQSFVLCCGKQLWQQPVLIPPNIMYRAVSFTVIPKCESCNWL